MCGIAGIYNKANAEADLEAVEEMLGVLSRRGPDDSGVHRWPNITLGHRRLSIFDLSSAGHQPMLSDDGKIGIVFNGAIYNFQKLRSELVSMGYQFRSRTDTEVLIYGYKAWGIDGLLSRIDGMYAFGLWDQSDQRLYLVRDRLGVKPLSFRVDKERLYFASTPRAINKVCPSDLCDMAVAEFLEFGFVTDEQSIFQGISKVRAGELVQWDGQKLTRRFYWDLNKFPRQEKVTFEDAVLETEKRFLDAVEKRLQSDVRVGTLLSGGIDSSLVCWAVGKLGGDVTSFTVGTPGEDVDETAAAAATAKQLGVRHRLLQLRPTTTALVDELVDAYDEPFGAPSALAMLSISREVKEFATVLLTGDGGDDVFLGYPEHKHFYLSQRISRLTPPQAAGVWGALRNAIPRVGLLKRGASFLDYSIGGLGAVGNARDGLPFYARNQLLGERIREISIPHRQMEWGLESGRDLLARFLAYDRVTRFVGEYLTKVDRATMYHGIEARSPFLDIKLWEYAHTLPFSLHLYQGRTKSILREIARRRVGGEVAFRKKQGFVIPVLKWLSHTWRNEFDRLLNDSVLHKNGWIDAHRVKRLFGNIRKNQLVPRQLWLIFVLESWLRSDAEYMNPVLDVHTR